MANVDLSTYKSLYIETARKYIGDMNTALVQLGTDKTKKEAIESMHISSHSLKSQSQIMTYVKTGALSGSIEALFRNIREGKIQLTEDMLNQLKEAVSLLSASVDSIEKENAELDVTQATEEIKKFVPAQ